MKDYIVYTAMAAMLASSAYARTKLVTLPDREALVLNMDHSEAALLYEERYIPLQQGTNAIDFSWNGVSIDSDSVLLEILQEKEGVELPRVIATSFPPNENALTWEVYAPEPGAYLIRVSYLLSGVAKSTSYEMRVNSEETEGRFQQRLLLTNQSGEDLDDARLEIRGVDKLKRSIDSGEARRLTTIDKPSMPVEKLYISKPIGFKRGIDDKEEIQLVYRLNNSENIFGGELLLDSGKARIFGNDGDDGTILLGEDILLRTAPGENSDLSIGNVKDISVKRRFLREERINQRFDDDKNLQVFDLEQTISYELENFKEEEVTLLIEERVFGDWEVVSISSDVMDWEREDVNTLRLTASLPGTPAATEPEKVKVEVELIHRNRFPNE